MAEAGRAERLAEWLETRLDGVDAALAARVRSALGDAAASGAVADAPHLLLSAAVTRLEPLAMDGCTARQSAIELLAVDTLVTLACEALVDTCAGAEDIAAHATAMVRAIAAAMPELDGAA